MPEPADLTSVETHFAFGKSWAAYAEKIAQPEIDEAIMNPGGALVIAL